MSEYINELYRATMSLVVHMDRNEWLVAAGVLMTIGIFFMRGFGSRTSY